MLAQLGDVQFLVVGPLEGLSRERRYGYAAHAVYGGKPRLQAVGDELDTLSLALAFHDWLGDPDVDIRALDDAAARHEALPFVLGTGELLGRFVVQSLSLELRETDALGAVLQARVRVELLEWVDDTPLELLTAARARATRAAAAAEVAATTVRTASDDAAEVPSGDFRSVTPDVITRAAADPTVSGGARAARVTFGREPYVDVATRDGERWDQVAARVLGDALGYPSLTAANPDAPLLRGTLDRITVHAPLRLVADAAARIAPDVASLPPWKRT
jgi:phage protein U